MNYDPTGLAALAAILFFIGILIFAVAAGIYVLTAFFMMRTFQKMGIAGWKAWIPVYNTWVWLEQGKLPGALALLLLLPSLAPTQPETQLDQILQQVGSLAGLAVLVLTMVATARLAPKFGKPKEYWLLVLIPPVLFGLLASKKVTYQG